MYKKNCVGKYKATVEFKEIRNGCINVENVWHSVAAKHDILIWKKITNVWHSPNMISLSEEKIQKKNRTKKPPIFLCAQTMYCPL